MDDPQSAAPVTDPGTSAPVQPETPQPEGNLNWLLSLPEELQNDNLLTNFKSVEDLARGYSETKRWADGRVKMPDENTPPDEVSKFYARLGVPDRPEGYEFTKVDVPAGVGIDPAIVDSFKPIFLDAKLTKTQADKIQAAYLKSVSEQHNKLVQDYTTELNQKVEVLKGRWGDEFETKVGMAQRYFNASAPPNVKKYVELNGLGNDPDFIEWMYQKGVETGEDTFRSGSPVENSNLDDEIKAIDRQVMDTSPNDPAYRGLVEKRNTLYERRWPQRPE